MEVIKNVTLEEIRDADGAQMYSFPWTEGMPKHLKPPCNVVWLVGWNCAINVQVGDKGVLEFQSGNRGSAQYGLYFFHKTDNQSVQATGAALFGPCSLPFTLGGLIG